MTSDGVRMWRSDGGVVLLGRGVAGRWEIAIEVEDVYRGQGLGRRLARTGRHLLGAGRAVWAQPSGTAIALCSFDLGSAT
ncbi:hypothetical protein [Streptosporangium sp. NPDC048865]|uniref:hypothetical protein n=1 Tax=Streptosporangium sp. NPDC048865 TaxID=3155766 RepID=UPI00344532E9